MRRHAHTPRSIAVCMVASALAGHGCAASRGVAPADDRQRAGQQDLQERPANMNPVSYFEIPVIDMARATRFYERVLLVDFEHTEIDGHPMALFPYDKDAPGITGALAHGNSYHPGTQGVRIYFNVNDIDATLRRAVDAGGKVLYPKTSIGEHGFVAEFQDSEGNCIAIRSSGP
jgi:uncharacterized protein